MTRRLLSGQPGTAGGIGVAVVASADGSIDWTSPTGPTADGSVRAIGAETFIRTAAELNGLAVGGLITFNGNTMLTGVFALDPGNHILNTVTGSLAGTHSLTAGVTGDYDGPLVEGTNLEYLVISNSNLGLLAEDLLTTDLSGRFGRVDTVLLTGTRGGTIEDLAGGLELVDVVPGGGIQGLRLRGLFGAFRTVYPSGIPQAPPAATPGYVQYDLDATVVIPVTGWGLYLGAFQTFDPSHRVLSIDDGITLNGDVVRVIGAGVPGPGKLLDQSPGKMDANDVRIVIKATDKAPEFGVLAQAVFVDSITPILYTPLSADLTDFRTILIQNVGPTTTIALTSISHRVALDVSNPADWHIEILGPIDDLSFNLDLAIGVTKTGTTREVHFKWFIKPQGLGPWVPLDVTLSALEVSTTQTQQNGHATEIVDSGDWLQMQVSSEATDVITISSETFSAKAGG